MEDQEEWAEPGGDAMVIPAKFLLAGAFVAHLRRIHPVRRTSNCTPSHLAFGTIDCDVVLFMSISGFLAGRKTIDFLRTKNA
jgi:hypothetical protein